MHPSKKIKRSHGAPSQSSSPPPVNKIKLESTPPPSPRPEHKCVDMTPSDDDPAARIVDLDGINDDIVEAVIVQLQNTGNRPHLVKELAAVLMQQLKVVQQ